MSFQIAQCLLVNIVDSIELFRLDSERHSRLGHICLDLPLECPIVNECLFQFPRLLPQFHIHALQPYVFLLDCLLEETQLFFINANEVVFGCLQLSIVFFLQF